MIQPELIFITGLMKSGKSEKLLEAIDKADDNADPYLVLKPSADTRDGEWVATRAHDRKHRAVLVNEQNHQMVRLIKNSICNYNAVFIDEIQFFSDGFVKMVADYCYTHGATLIVSGLSKDFTGKEFPSSSYLLDMADRVIHCHGKCDCCQRPAYRDVLVNRDTNTLVTGGSNVVVEGSSNVEYLSVCKDCHKTLFVGIK